jgi:hypothetical protein
MSTVGASSMNSWTTRTWDHDHGTADEAGSVSSEASSGLLATDDGEAMPVGGCAGGLGRRCLLDELQGDTNGCETRGSAEVGRAVRGPTNASNASGGAFTCADQAAP